MFIAVNYHYIRDDFSTPYPSIFGVTPSDFGKQLDCMGRFFNFLSLDDVHEIVSGKKNVPDRAVIVTFDDGFKEQYELAWPIMRKKGIPGIFYVNTKPIVDEFVTITHKIHLLRGHIAPGELIAEIKKTVIDNDIKKNFPDYQPVRKVYKYDTDEVAQVKYFLNYSISNEEKKIIVDKCFKMLGFDEEKVSNQLYMTKDMVVELSKHRLIGAHGHSHIPLGLVDLEAACEDLRKSFNILNSWFDKKVCSLSYPFGFEDACSEEVASFASLEGIKFALTMERAGNNRDFTPMFLSRFSSSDFFKNSNNFDFEKFWPQAPSSTWFKNSRIANNNDYS